MPVRGGDLMTSPNPLRLTVIDYEPIPGITPEQAERASRCIAGHALDADDARLLLDIAFGKPQVRPPRGFKGRSPRDEAELKPCGTEAAYQRHKARGEECEACRLAANEARAASGRRVRARRRAEGEVAK